MPRLGAQEDEDLLQQVNVLSPDTFSSANEYIQKAEHGRDKNEPQRDVLHSIAISKAYLTQAEQNAKTAQVILNEAIQNRRLALNARAKQNYASELNEVDADLISMTRKIENGFTDDAVFNKNKLSTQYAELEMKSILKNNLGPAQDKMQQSLNEGAKILTPLTLEGAQAKLKESTELVISNRHNPNVIANARENANLASDGLLNMVREAKRSSIQSPEQLATAFEADKNKFDNSKSQLNHERLESNKNRVESQRALQGKNQDIANLSAQNKILASEDKQEQNYESARELFTESEADVYKQGDKILLRLKGLSFPVSGSTILKESYQILSKVQKTIRESGAKSIRIEGHTDSTGTTARNAVLSQARAKSVEEYLAANEPEDSEKIHALGLGETQPISSNKTAAGRAQNRRVDIVLSTSVIE